jgi:hypothetical protein
MRMCTVCGEQRSSDRPWFLLAENRWEDKLKILQWNDRLASNRGIHQACSTAHVQELVVHWMIAGSLDHPFANPPATPPVFSRRFPVNVFTTREIDTRYARELGELSVHRESMTRLLDEQPESLASMLRALGAALRSVSDKTPSGTQWERLVLASSREV